MNEGARIEISDICCGLIVHVVLFCGWVLVLVGWLFVCVCGVCGVWVCVCVCVCVLCVCCVVCGWVCVCVFV